MCCCDVLGECGVLYYEYVKKIENVNILHSPLLIYISTEHCKPPRTFCSSPSMESSIDLMNLPAASQRGNDDPGKRTIRRRAMASGKQATTKPKQPLSTVPENLPSSDGDGKSSINDGKNKPSGVLYRPDKGDRIVKDPKTFKPRTECSCEYGSATITVSPDEVYGWKCIQCLPIELTAAAAGDTKASSNNIPVGCLWQMSRADFVAQFGNIVCSCGKFLCNQKIDPGSLSASAICHNTCYHCHAASRRSTSVA